MCILCLAAHPKFYLGIPIRIRTTGTPAPAVKIAITRVTSSLILDNYTVGYLHLFVDPPKYLCTYGRYLPMYLLYFWKGKMGPRVILFLKGIPHHFLHSRTWGCSHPPSSPGIKTWTSPAQPAPVPYTAIENSLIDFSFPILDKDARTQRKYLGTVPRNCNCRICSPLHRTHRLNMVNLPGPDQRHTYIEHIFLKPSYVMNF